MRIAAVQSLGMQCSVDAGTVACRPLRPKAPRQLVPCMPALYTPLLRRGPCITTAVYLCPA